MTQLQIALCIIALIALAAVIAFVLIRRANRQFYRELEYLDARLKAEAAERAARVDEVINRGTRIVGKPAPAIPVGDPRHPAMRRAAGDTPSKRQPVIPQPTSERAKEKVRHHQAAAEEWLLPTGGQRRSDSEPPMDWPAPVAFTLSGPVTPASGSGGSFDGGGASGDWSSSSSSSDSSSSSSSDSGSSSSSSSD